MAGQDEDERGFFAERPSPHIVKVEAAKEKPHYLGHRERLRERFASSASGDAFADYELLELLLFRLIPRADTKPIAKALLARFGSLSEVLGAPAARLQEVKGVGAAVALDLKVVAAAAKRMARGEIQGREVLSSWEQVLDYCRASIGFEAKEQFRMLWSVVAMTAEQNVGFLGQSRHSPIRSPMSANDP